MSKFQLLDKDNSALIFIDHQPQMSFGVANIDRQQLKNNVVGLAKPFSPRLKPKVSAATSGQNCWRFTLKSPRLNALR